MCREGGNRGGAVAELLQFVTGQSRLIDRKVVHKTEKDCLVLSKQIQNDVK